MPGATDIGLRNRALVAFTLLSGARDNAIASMSLKHVNLERRAVFQDARDVRTKNRKTFTSTFFPVGGPFEDIVRDWIGYLTTERLFGPDDPLFSATEVGIDENGLFSAMGIGRARWSNAGPIRKVFREAFECAGLSYFNPHSFRDTLGQLGERICRTPEEFKAWSQNLGHDSTLTTFNSYGNVAGHRQVEIMNRLAKAEPAASPSPDSTTLARMERMLEEIAAGINRYG